MKIYLAPMQGVTDHHMRALLQKVGGIDLCFTEFIRVNDHVLPEKVFHRYCPELSTEGSFPVRVQLLGSRPDILAKNAAKAAKLGAAGIDLNFGCPAKTVNKNRGGACLLNETPLIQDIVTQVRDAVPAHLPVSAKIRLGFDERDSYLRNADAIERAGATEMIVHARSKADGYKPPAYWEAVGEIRRAVRIPVVANGEIWSIQDFLRCQEVSGCASYMLGRGLLSRPDLALSIKGLQRQAMASKPSSTPQAAWQDISPLLLEFFRQTCAFYPKKYTGNRLKQWLFYLQRHFSEAEKLFNQIKAERDEQRIRVAILNSAH